MNRLKLLITSFLTLGVAVSSIQVNGGIVDPATLIAYLTNPNVAINSTFTSIAGLPGATNSPGGSATVSGGAGNGAFNGGAVAIVGGQSGLGATGAGGAASLTGGAAASTNDAGGAASVVGGLGTGTGAGGAITITSGAAGATGVAGAVNISVGAATAGNGSAVTITGGAGAGGTNSGGNINLVPGAAVSTGTPGVVQINGASGFCEVTFTQPLSTTAVPATASVWNLFVANRAWRVAGVRVTEVVFGTSETYTFTKETTTGAPGSGTAICTGAVTPAVSNTVVAGTLVATVSTLLMAAGDRISVKIGGTVTNATGLTISLLLQPA